MLYHVSGRGKPLGLIAPSKDNSRSPSMEDELNEIGRFRPRYQEYVEPSYYDDEDDDGDWGDIYISRDVYDPPGINWVAMKKA